MTQEIYDNMNNNLETLHHVNLTTGLNSIQVKLLLTAFQIILDENLKLSQKLEALEEQVQKTSP